MAVYFTHEIPTKTVPYKNRNTNRMKSKKIFEKWFIMIPILKYMSFIIRENR